MEAQLLELTMNAERDEISIHKLIISNTSILSLILFIFTHSQSSISSLKSNSEKNHRTTDTGLIRSCPGSNRGYGKEF